MDAQSFLGIEAGPKKATGSCRSTPPHNPGQFLFGGCGIAAALVALEAASGRPTIWATAQYLAFAKTDSLVDYEVTLSKVGGHITQARAVGRVDDGEILTVNAALGGGVEQDGGVWVLPPAVPPPDECPPRRLPSMMDVSIFDRVETRVAIGAGFEEIGHVPRTPTPRCGHACPGISNPRPRHWPSSATT